MNKYCRGVLLCLLFLPYVLFGEVVYDSFPQPEFTAAISSGMLDLHPHSAFNADEAQMLTALYEGLCVYDPYTLQPLPGMAKSWEVSSDGLEWTFVLREGLSFENGDPITAQTFRDSFINLINPLLKLPYSSLLDCIQGVKAYRTGISEDAETIGLYAQSGTVLKMVLAYPAEHLPYLLCHHAFSAVHPSQLAAVQQSSSRNAGGSRFIPIASGAFKIASADAGRLQLVKNEQYWDTSAVGLPSLTVLLNIEPDEAAERFNEGTLHWTNGVANLSKIAAAHTVHVTPMFATEYLYFKSDVFPTDDAAVRNALTDVLPYEQLRKDYLIPAKTLIFPFAGYPSTEKTESYSVEKAKKILKELAVSSQAVPLKILLPESSGYSKMAEILKAAWEACGIAVDIELCPLFTYQEALKSRTYHIAVVSWIGDFADPLAFLELFRTDSHFNASGWKSADYEKLLQKAALEHDHVKRLKILAQAELVLLNSAAIIPLAHIPAINIIDLYEIRGWHNNPVNIHPFKFIRFAIPEALPGVVLNGVSGRLLL
ncbi:MAG: peptide ABC transporter substrate-binding protein [Treponema sp.]